MASGIDKNGGVRRALVWAREKFLWVWHNRPHGPSSFTEWRRLAVDASVLLLVGGLLLVTVEATYDKTLVIEPISVPKALEEMGYTGSALAQKLMDRVYAINDKSKSFRDKVQYGSEGRFAAASAIRLPSSSVSVQTVVALLRSALGIQGDRIAGEITTIPPDDAKTRPTYVLTLHLTHLGKRFSNTQKGADLDELIDQAGLAIVGQFDRVTLAGYYQSTSDWEKADPLIDSLIASGDPDGMPDAMNLHGQSLKHQHRDDEARATFEKIATLFPNFVDAYGNWGSMLREQGKYADAIEKFRRAVELDPKYATGYQGWGLTLYIQQDYPGAIAKYQRAIGLVPNNVWPHIALGLALSDQGNYAGAFEQYQTAIALDPKNSVAYTAWGTTLAGKRDYPGAVEKYQKAITLNPKDQTAYLNWGNALAEQRDYPHAVEKYQKAVELDPTYGDGYYDWGNTLYAQGDYAGAIEKYQKAVTLVCDDLAVVYDAWGLALSNRPDRDYDGAIEKYRKSAELRPNFANAFRHWGDALAAKGDKAGADEKRRQADQLARK